MKSPFDIRDPNDRTIYRKYIDASDDRTSYRKFLDASSIGAWGVLRFLRNYLSIEQLFQEPNPMSLLEPFILDKSVILFTSTEVPFPLPETDLTCYRFEQQSILFSDLESARINNKLTGKNHDDSPDISDMSLKIRDIVKCQRNADDEYILYISTFSIRPNYCRFVCVVVDECLWDIDLEKRKLKYYLSALNFLLSKTELDPQTNNYFEARIELRKALVELQETARSLQKGKDPEYKPYTQALLKWTYNALNGKYFDYFTYKIKGPRKPMCLGFNLINLRMSAIRKIHEGLTCDDNPTSLPFIAEIQIETLKEILTSQNLREYCQNTSNYITWTSELKNLYCFIDNLKIKMSKTLGTTAMIDDSKCFRYSQERAIKIHGSQNLHKKEKEVSPEITQFFEALFTKK